jgi:hypothetical protein
MPPRLRRPRISDMFAGMSRYFFAASSLRTAPASALALILSGLLLLRLARK